MAASDSNDSDNSSSSEEEMGFEEDVHTINKIRNQIKELKLELETNAFIYDKHILLIELLRKVKDEEELRDARNKMRSIYPLTEELWLQWIKEDDQFDDNLFKLAVKDYISVDIWIEYTYFSMKKLGELGGDNIVRSVYEEALTQVGLHPTKGLLIWEAYREFEIAMLQSVQPPPGSIATPEQINKSNEITKNIEKLFTRQLMLPLKEMDKTLEEYKSFINADCDKQILNAFKKAFAYWEDIKSFEDKLENVSSNKMETYEEYINFELSRQQPARIQIIFERAIQINCLDAALWLRYISYVTIIGIETLVMPLHERSVRNCPWNCNLWVKYLLALERFNSSDEKVEEIFSEAMQGGFILPSDYLKLWSTRIDMLRRKIDWSSENHDETLNKFRTSIERGIGQLLESYGSNGDPNCSLQQYWAFIEAKYCKNMIKARELWTSIMQSGFGDQAMVWLEYISIERSFGDVKHCRKVFHRAINSVSDWPENICEAYLTFERQEGTLSTYEEALTRVEAQLRRINEKRANEALKEIENTNKFKKNVNGENKFGKRKKFKQAPKNTDELKPYQRKNKFNEKMEVEKEKWNKQEKIIKIEPNSEDESVFKKPLVFDKKLLKKPALSSVKSEFGEKSMPPPSSKNILKRASDNKTFLEELLAKKPKLDTNKNTLREFKENQTIFVSNLDYSITSDQLKEFFSKIGEISDVRIVSNYKKQSKGFAFVEFADEFPVEKALSMDREPLDGRPMFVARCDTHRSAESKLKFRLGLEKNKLFVKNLLTTVTKEMLIEVFSPLGSLKDVRIVTFRNGHSKGLAYVEYVDQSAATQAVLKMDGFELGGQKISVAISNPPPKHPPNDMPFIAASSHPPKNIPDTRSSFVPSLGGGKKDVGRGNARTNLSFLPRTFMRPQHVAVDVKPTKAECLKLIEGNSTMSEITEQNSETSSQTMSNDDFRSMLLRK